MDNERIIKAVKEYSKLANSAIVKKACICSCDSEYFSVGISYLDCKLADLDYALAFMFEDYIEGGDCYKRLDVVSDSYLHCGALLRFDLHIDDIIDEYVNNRTKLVLFLNSNFNKIIDYLNNDNEDAIVTLLKYLSHKTRMVIKVYDKILYTIKDDNDEYDYGC